MSEQLLVVSKVKPLLLALDGVKTIGADVLVELSEQVRRSIPHAMTWCRLTPTGRLMVQKSVANAVEKNGVRYPEHATIQAEGAADDEMALGEGDCVIQEETGGDSLEKTAWRMAAFNGDTLLGFYEWNTQQKK